MWKAYFNLGLHFKRYNMINHSVTFRDQKTSVHTNTIEGNWRSLKASISNRCRTEKLAPLFLFRYMIIRNETPLPLKF